VVDVLTWALVVGGLIVAVVAALNLFGLPRGRLRSDSLGRTQSLAFVMMGAGIAGFLWPPFPADDAIAEPWRFCWLGVLGAGFALLMGPEIWRSWRRRARTEGDALFFLRVNTNRHDWRPKHFVLLGASAASAPLTSLMPDNWWQFVAWIPFMVLLESLRILPFRRVRRPPNTLDSAPQP
jgi:hypothetical protein